MSFSWLLVLNGRQDRCGLRTDRMVEFLAFVERVLRCRSAGGKRMELGGGCVDVNGGVQVGAG